MAYQEGYFYPFKNEAKLRKDYSWSEQPKKHYTAKSEDKPDDKAGAPVDRFKDAAIIYSLYMHLVPPKWSELDKDEYARAVPWFQKLVRWRHGGVVDMDPLSAKVGTTYWSEKLTANDSSLSVR